MWSFRYRASQWMMQCTQTWDNLGKVDPWKLSGFLFVAEHFLKLPENILIEYDSLQIGSSTIFCTRPALRHKRWNSLFSASHSF